MYSEIFEKGINMVKVFSILGATFIAIATIGFLLIQHFLDNKIKDKNSKHISFIYSQKETLSWIEKANLYREQASFKKDNISIMKTLNVTDNIITKSNEVYIQYLRISVVNTINALAASEKINNEKSEKLVSRVDSLLEPELTKEYLANAQEAAKATADLAKKIEKNMKNVQRLEKTRDILWTFCFTFQSLGLFCGLLVIIYKNS